MVYMRPSNQELIDRVNARLGIENRAPDDPLAGPIRMKRPDELPGYTQETPGQESARITGEYNRAGSNARTTYGEISEFATSIPMGAATGLATLGSTVIDPAAAYMGYGTPITNRLVQNNRQLQEGGEGGVDSFVRNVVSSVVSNAAAAVGGTLIAGPGGGIAAVGVVNAVPTAMQQYQIGMEEGLTDMQAKARAAAYGVVAGTVSTVVEKILPGTTAAITGQFSKAIADDIAIPLTRAIFTRLSRSSASEGAEEGVQEIANQFIDAATTQITGNRNLEKPYASFSERLMDIGQAIGMGAAAGGLIQGGVELVNTRRAIQEIGAQPVQPQPEQAATTPPIAGQMEPTQVTQSAPKRPPLMIDPDLIPQQIQEFANSLTPEQQDALSEAARANQGVLGVKQMAAALGMDPDNLPDFLYQFDNRDLLEGAVGFARDTETAIFATDRYSDGKPVKIAAVPIREFLAAITPQQKLAIASLEKPSRSAFAQILGVDTNALPPIVMSQNGRNAAAIVASRDLQKAGNTKGQPQVEPVNPTNVTGSGPVNTSGLSGGVSMPNSSSTTETGTAGSTGYGQVGTDYGTSSIAGGINPYTSDSKKGGARPGPLSEFMPTGAEMPATSVIPSPQRNFTGPDSKQTTTLREIDNTLQQFSEALTGVKIPISEGVPQEPGSWLFGRSYGKVGSIRRANRQDALTLSHEIAHHVDNTTDVFTSAPASVQAELTRVGTNPDYHPTKWLKEGRAEFIRAWFQEGPAFAQNVAPETFKYFSDRMKSKHGKAFKAFQKAGELYRVFNPGMNAKQRARSQIVRRDDVGEALTRTATGLVGIGNKVVGNFWDIAEVGRRMVDNVAKYSKLMTGKAVVVPPEKRPDRMLDFLHGLAATRGKEMILDGMIDAEGNRTGQMGLRQVLEPLGGVDENIADFELLIVAKRVLAIGDGSELAKLNSDMAQVFGDQWETVMPRSGPITVADARAIVAELEAKNPILAKVAEDYYRFWDNVLEYMADMSPTLAASVRKIRLRDPGSYTPFMRLIESNGKASPVASAQSGQIGRRLKGSNRAIIDPLTQAVQVVEARLATAHQRKLLETIVELADDNNAYSWGMARFIEKLEPGVNPDGHSIEVVNAQGGKDRYQINDPGVMMMLSALDPVALSSIPVFGKALDVTFGKPSALLKTFATGINPRFALVTQPLFNVWELMAKGASFTDRYDSKGASNALTAAIRRSQNHGQLIGDWLRFWLARTVQQTGRAMGAKIDGNSWGSVPFLGQAMKYLDRAKQEGVEFSQSIRNDDSAAFDVSREAAGLQNSAVFRNPVKIIQEDGASGLMRWMFSSIPGWVGDTLNASEYAAKAAVLKSFLEGQGLDLNSSLSMRQKVDLSRATKESFGNYARRGATSRYLEKLSPYLTSPQVHGRSLLEAVKEDPANVMQVGMYLLIGSFLLTLRNLQDDEYREADPAQKARYVHFGNSNEGWSLLPAYSDFMTVFHGAGVILAHLYDGSDAGSQAVETTKTLASQFFPVPNPVLPAEAISQFAGQDLRTGRDIVPNYKDRREGDAQATVISQRPAREQYTDKTSRIAVGLGWATGISPIRIEHALDSLTARFVTDIEKVGRGMKSPQSIVLPRTREPGLLSAKDQATTDLYAELKKANERKNDPNVKESPLHREQRLMLESADSARDAYTALMRREKDQDKTNEYSRLQRGLSRTAVTMYRAGEYSHSPFRVAKRIADVELARLDQDDAEVAKLVYNGIDGLMRARPMKAGQGKTMAETVAAWEEDRAEAQALRDALVIPKADLIKLTQEHMRNTKVPAGLMMSRMAKLNAALK